MFLIGHGRDRMNSGLLKKLSYVQTAIVFATVFGAVATMPTLANAAAPTLDKLYKSSTNSNIEAYSTAANAKFAYLSIKGLDFEGKASGALTLKVGAIPLDAINLKSEFGTSQRVEIDVTLVAPGPQEVTATWAPEGSMSPSTSAAVTLEFTKSAFAKAPAPQLDKLYKSDKTTSVPTSSNIQKPLLKLTFGEAAVPAGALYIDVGSERLAKVVIEKGAEKAQFIPLDFGRISMRESRDLTVVWDPDGDGDGQLPSVRSNPVPVDIDTVPPVITGVKLLGVPGGAATLEIRFAENDLEKSPNATGENATAATSVTTSANYTFRRSAGMATIETEVSGLNIAPRLNTANDAILIALTNLYTDTYQVTVKNIKDGHGNLIDPVEQSFTFTSFPSPESAKHVEFPEYTARPDRNKKSIFNPGDRVETRVARLYYFRDAHRAAQIVNRNVKSYNRAAVTMAQQAAEEARTVANQKTADRKQREAAAIRAAEATRAAEQELAAARQTLEDIRAVNAQAQQGAAAAKSTGTQISRLPTRDTEALQRQITDVESKITQLDEWITADSGTLKGYDNQIIAADDLIVDYEAKNANGKLAEGDDAKYRDIKSQRAVVVTKRQALLDRLAKEKSARELAISQRESLEAKKTELANQVTDLNSASETLTSRSALARTSVSEFVAKVAAAEEKVASLRATERDRQQDVDAAQEVEDRAKENQFRAEVAAASADPDTYVPADVTSVDPVTQVSVSVIGEGVIQLRGPIRGINKIRTMINQIDSPVGQVKVGIFTVQVNGEHGDRMEKVATRIEGNIDISRYLTNQSLGLLRRSIQEVAGLVVRNVDTEMRGHRQVDRDRRYLYGFFGRDFVDELYEMDSEFLRSENKLLSLHSMDTVNQSQAFFILSIAKNDIRQMILERFRYLIQCEMPCLEWDFRRSADMTRRCRHYKLNSLEEVTKHVHEKYHFNNLHGFFNALVDDSDAMTPMQREFIRLAQIFKSQMVAEMEYKQRVIERGLIEDQANDEDDFNTRLEGVRLNSQQEVVNAMNELVNGQEAIIAAARSISTLLATSEASDQSPEAYSEIISSLQSIIDVPRNRRRETLSLNDVTSTNTQIKALRSQISILVSSRDLFPDSATLVFSDLLAKIPLSVTTKDTYGELDDAFLSTAQDLALTKINGIYVFDLVQQYSQRASKVRPVIRRFLRAVSDPRTKLVDLRQSYEAMVANIEEEYGKVVRPKFISDVLTAANSSAIGLEMRIDRSKAVQRRVRRDLDHRKLLEFLTDEQEEKFIELEEGCRSHIAQIDNYLKRLAIALEDDFKVQFYDPAFAEVRRASREWDVNLGQIERTTILTNNRALAKVSPQATMEFDLPKRDIMITEAMGGAKAIVNEYGALLQDPTFLSVTGMLSGSPAVGGIAAGSAVPGLPAQGLSAAGVRNVLPGQSTDATEQLMAQTGGPTRKFGSEFEKLIPDPAVYKIETGTGFEIRPVIQPDGHSIVYDFDYMYTTNVREPVRPDEKHLGRVKRHFIHTEVQTSSFELREISRYQVALKVSRTSRGVPLMEDIPAVGVLFRPLPSAESSLQQNIILGQSTVYPTLFDLMGLRWSKHIVDLDHVGLRDTEHVVRGRNTTIHDFTFDEGSRRVDEFLDIETKDQQLVRPDLYRQQRQASPYHPGGYQYRRLKDERDPTGREFDRPDTRPEEFREPAYDSKYRVPVEQLPSGGTRPEVIKIGPGAEVQSLPAPPGSGYGLSAPLGSREPIKIEQMKYEPTPAAGGMKPMSKTPASGELPPPKPKMLKLPSLSTRRK